MLLYYLSCLCWGGCSIYHLCALKRLYCFLLCFHSNLVEVIGCSLLILVSFLCQTYQHLEDLSYFLWLMQFSKVTCSLEVPYYFFVCWSHFNFHLWLVDFWNFAWFNWACTASHHFVLQVWLIIPIYLFPTKFLLWWAFPRVVMNIFDFPKNGQHQNSSMEQFLYEVELQLGSMKLCFVFAYFQLVYFLALQFEFHTMLVTSASILRLQSLQYIVLRYLSFLIFS